MDISKLTNAGRKLLPLRKCGAVIVAAGSSSRMGGIDKIMAELGGGPMIARTIQTFGQCDAIQEIVVVTRPELIVPIRDLCVGVEKLRAVVSGGDSRQASVLLGLNALSEDMELAAVHDGARPLVTKQLIDRVVRAAHTYHAAAPAVPVKDTIKQADGGLVKMTLDRDKLWAVQTPQVFDYDLLRGALLQAQRDGVRLTDDCAAVERIGMSVKLVTGDERNLKVTTPLDLTIAKLFLEETQ